jgi:hypothetical protein
VTSAPNTTTPTYAGVSDRSRIRELACSLRSRGPEQQPLRAFIRSAAVLVVQAATKVGAKGRLLNFLWRASGVGNQNYSVSSVGYLMTTDRNDTTHLLGPLGERRISTSLHVWLVRWTA